jgi:hypothetical protein
MPSRTRLVASSASGLIRASRPALVSRTAAPLALRTLTQTHSPAAQNTTGNPLSSFIGANSSPTYFSSSRSLPANTIIRFVPQQTAWIVERMGKFHRILQPGLAVLLPIIDRIAYVRSLKENAIEIPSQSAITADNVTLELDGVLYTRVFDAYKARYGHFAPVWA